jgi:hypothetical protein
MARYVGIITTDSYRKFHKSSEMFAFSIKTASIVSVSYEGSFYK